MNMLKALFLCFCALAVVSCSDDEDPTGPDNGAKDNAFASKQGDHSTYDVYRLDENNQQVATTATYSTRTVLHTNMSFEGKTDVTMAVDSLFVTAGNTEVERVDTIYYRVENNDLYIYNFAETFISFVPPDFPLQLEPVPGWVKVAELKEGSSQFSSQLKVKATGLGELTVNIQGSNKGRQTADGYTVFQNDLTATGTVPVVNITVAIPITLNIGGVKNASNSPSTLIKMQINKFTNPSGGGEITGRVQTLSEFHAGS